MTPYETAHSAPLTCSLCATAILFHLAHLVLGERATIFLSLAVNNTMLQHWNIFNILTSSLFEFSSLKLLISAVCFGSLCLPLEAEWGTRPLAWFLLFVAVTSGMLTLLILVVQFFTISVHYLTVGRFGLAGLVIATAVARVVRSPEVPAFFGYPQLKLRFLPLPGLLAYTLGWGLELFAAADLLFAWIGFFGSVWYQRRFGEVEVFELDVFFPDFARPVVRAASLLVQNFFSRYCPRLVKSPSNQVNAGRATAATLPLYHAGAKTLTSPPPTKPKDLVAERRRARALKALDQKLAQIEREVVVPLDGGGSEE